MTTFCFAERPGELFEACALRGRLAGMRDWPHLKEQEALAIEASRVPDELRHEVCCIGEDEVGYRLLVLSAWSTFYLAVNKALPRDLATQKLLLRDVPDDEALRILVDEDVSTFIGRTYVQYQSALAGL